MTVALRTACVYKPDDGVPGCGRVSARTQDRARSVYSIIYSGMEPRRVQLFGECAECDG